MDRVDSLDAGAELRPGPPRHLPQPAHDARRQADAGQVEVAARHDAGRGDEHVGGVGELPVLVDGEGQRGRAGREGGGDGPVGLHLPLAPGDTSHAAVVKTILPCEE